MKRQIFKIRQNPESWGVKNSFFTKRILLFINNSQILRKSGIFVPFFASQKANRN
jgi:hypothetical protein